MIKITIVKIIIPDIPPSINSAYIMTKYGSRVINRNGKLFKETVNQCIEEQVHEDKQPVFTGHIRVDVVFYMPNDYRYLESDIDNRLKILMDALENKVSSKRKYTYKGKIFKDDKQIDCLTVLRIVDFRYPRTEVTITEHTRQIITYKRSVEQKELM